MKFSYKIHESGEDMVLAVSDASILGKKLEENELVFHVSEDFYSQETCDENNIKDLIKSATIINAVGKEIINLMINEKIIKNDKVIRISGVPHAQVISVK